MTFPKYPKIQSIYKRDMTQKHKPLIIGNFTCPEFEYLRNNEWEFTEKVDGTNIRILWDGNDITIGGRTDNAQIPAPLIQVINSMFNKDKLGQVFANKSVVIFGEGYGGKIQSGGKYRPNESFVCFDIFINDFWLTNDAVSEICANLNIRTVPWLGTFSLADMLHNIGTVGIKSWYGEFQAEGVVGTPVGDFLFRNGDRIITKIKCCDFNDETPVSFKVNIGK